MDIKLNPITLLKDLIRIDTTNPPGNEREALSYIKNILDARGIETVLQTVEGSRGNLIACIPGNKEKEKPSLILLSHIDVVLAKEEEWQYPPFEAREVDGYIYGRGTVDTKQLTVMELVAICALKDHGTIPDRDVYLLVTGDEESGSKLGLQYFLSHEISIGGSTILGSKILVNSDVISEGGGFPILAGGKEFYLCESGQKGCGTVEFIVKARQDQGPFFSSGDGIERAMALVKDIGEIHLENKLLETVGAFIDCLKHAYGDKPDFKSELSPMMQNIVTAMTENTMTVTMISGKNINEVTVTCDVRLIPGYGEDYLKEILDGLSGKWDCDYHILSFWCGYESRIAGGLTEILEASTLHMLKKTKAEVQLLPFISMGSSDGRFLAPLGARVYGYSPVLSWDMTFDQAVKMVHGINERIHINSLQFGCNVLEKAVQDCVGKGEKYD